MNRIDATRTRREDDPNGLQALLDYRDERARQEQALLKQRNAGHPHKVDPKDLQSLLDYRDERARLEQVRLRQHDDVPGPEAAESGSGSTTRRPQDDRRGRRPPQPEVEPESSSGPVPSARSAPRDAVPENDARASQPDHRESEPGAVGDDENVNAIRTDEPLEPDLASLVEEAKSAEVEDPGIPRLSNRIRPPEEGDARYIVDDPDDLSNTITDIDLVLAGTLWEVKSLSGHDPRTNIDRWVERQVQPKLDKYVEARQHLEGYESAPIGLIFTNPETTQELRSKVEASIDAWRHDNPDIDVKTRWAQ